MRRRKLARTSRTPGRTRAIHYYQVGDRCYFVDLPGYGYAAVPEGVRRSWAPMIERYLDSSPRLAGVLSLVEWLCRLPKRPRGVLLAWPDENRLDVSDRTRVLPPRA